MALLVVLIGCSKKQQEEQKPNIIFILADDYGYMDTRAYATHVLGTPADSMFYETPNLDRLVSEGVGL